MTTTLVLIASGILIGAGIGVIWRDVQRSRRKAFVPQRALSTGGHAFDAEVEITIAPLRAGLPVYDRPSVLAAQAPRTQPTGEPIRPLAELHAAATEAPPEPWTQVTRQSGPEARWAALQAAIDAGIAQLNAVLAPARLSLGAAGEAAWSYRHQGYGAYRRLLLGEESLAWVRTEVTENGVLQVGIKAHKPQWAEVNGTVDAPADGLTAAAVSDLLSACLKPAATLAAQMAHDGPVHLASGDNAWQEVDAVVAAAIRATNGALAQTGARLLPLAPAAWDAELRRHRMTLAVEVDASDVARMQIERLPHEVEVAVGVKDVQMLDLGRRRRIPVDGMTTHALAELIASCAWPAIARFKEARRPAI